MSELVLKEAAEIAAKIARLQEENRQLKERVQFLEKLAIRFSNRETDALQAPHCVCGSHRPGQDTGGWQCPVHGQCF